MSAVQRFNVIKYGAHPSKNGYYMLHSDHERVVAELREAHEKALRESVQQSEDIHTRNLASTYDTAYATGVDDERVRWMVATQQAGDLLAASVKATFAANPRTLTAASPEPGVGSVVLDGNGAAWQLGKGGLWWIGGSHNGHAWAELLTLGPLIIIHDSDEEEN